MLEQIKTLETTAQKLEPSPDLRSKWDRAITDYAAHFIDTIKENKAYNTMEKEGSGLANFPIADAGRDVAEILELIRDYVDFPHLNPASGGHLAYIPGGGIYTTALGDYLAAVTNRYAGVFYASPGAVRIENQLIRWMNAIVGFPENALGNLTSGGSIANLIAITTARDAKHIRAKDIENAVIYTTVQAHHSIHKAIRIAGLDEAQLSYIPTDARFRMDIEELEKKIVEDMKAGKKPFLLIGSAGTTDTGAIDPMDRMADIAKEYDMWYHVDAAYGGFFVLADEVKDAFKGMERADSITIDPHKGLFLAYGLGAVLIRDVAALRSSHYYEANYMQDTFDSLLEPSPADLSPELTKHFRGMRLWLSLQLLGLEPFKAALSEKILLCRYFYTKIQALGFAVGPYPDLSVCIYRYIPDTGDANAFNARLVEAVRQDGRVFLSSTTINGVFWIRIAILCFRSHLDYIDLSLQILAEKVKVLNG